MTSNSRSGEWSPSSWRDKKAAQQPNYENPAKVASCLEVIRRKPPITTQGEVDRLLEELAEAAIYLRSDWSEVSTRLQGIAARTSKDGEREVAGFLRSTFKGLGPKQSRNLIQWLGLSRFEVPLDSRMVKVLRKLQFPVPLSPTALSDESYYCFVEDGLQSMLAQIGIYPCIFDACVFASLERVSKVPANR